MTNQKTWNGRALRLRRLERGWSQSRLGEAAGGIDVGTISRYENGWIEPIARTAVRLSKALGCPLSALYRKARVQ